MVWNWIFAIILLLILWSFVERKFLIVSKYKLNSSKLNANKEPIDIVVLADLHNNTFGKHNQRMLRRIDLLKPDFIILAGDIITKQKPCYPSHAYDLLEQLSSKYPLYYAYGNHELFYDIRKESSAEGDMGIKETALIKAWIEYLEKLRELGVHLLRNDSQTIIMKNKKLRISGLNLGLEYYPKGNVNPVPAIDMDRLLDKPGEEYQLLIAHNPMFFDDYAKWGADLTLAGHLHGGLARLPFLGGVISPQYKFFPGYDAGRFTIGDKNMVVSRGLGSHSIMMRLFNPPDLVFIRLASENLDNK